MWLQTHSNWLLILDNADDLSLLPPFLPSIRRGHLLLTTRAQVLGRLAQCLEVETLPVEQGALFLLRRASLIAPDVELPQASLDDCQSAKAISLELGGLPLALDQAGAYLEGTRFNPSEYCKIYRQRRTQLLNERGGVVSDHPEPVATTWSLSFERVEQQHPTAADLLRLCAYLSADAIPEEIVTQGAGDLGPPLSSVMTDPFLFGQAIEVLRASSLLNRDPQSQCLSVHRLVQAVLVDRMHELDRKWWAERTVRAVNATFPEEIDPSTWKLCDRLLPHALRCASLIQDYQLTFPMAIRLLNQTGVYLKARARYQEAEPLVIRALSILEQQLGATHPDTALALNLLANLFQDQGKYTEAEPLYLHALAIREHQLGTTHPDTALTLNHLASLYRTQGKYSQAEPLVKRALAIYKQQLGPQHPHTASSLNNLASLYYQQGKYTEAEPLYLHALAIREHQLGTTHPGTARILNNLAELYRDQGKYTEAEPLYLRALTIREQQLGTGHPHTARSLNNLAELYRDQGKYAEAEPLYLRALFILEQALGREHPSTRAVHENYTSLQRDLGRNAEDKQPEEDA